MPRLQARRGVGQGFAIATIEGPLRVTLADFDTDHSMVTLEIERAGQVERRVQSLREPLIIDFGDHVHWLHGEKNRVLPRIVRMDLSTDKSRPGHVYFTVEAPLRWLIAKTEEKPVRHATS
jgi:hypothetical protein